MISYVKRDKLDTKKYDKCISEAGNSRIYAYSWYLDIVADNWDVLVLNNYVAVMPLPWRSKYFFKYIYPPCWTQQLGVFSKEKVSSKLIKDFVKAIPKKFVKVTIQFNAENDVSNIETFNKNNYILPLNKEYKEIYHNYKINRKKGLKYSESLDLNIKETSVTQIIGYLKEYYPFIGYTEENYASLKRLSNYLIENSFGKIKGVYNNNDEFLGGIIFLKDAKRITYLVSVVNEKGKKNQAISFLIDAEIKNNANRNIVFDFEGSMLEGIAKFFKTFGAKKEVYFGYIKGWLK